MEVQNVNTVCFSLELCKNISAPYIKSVSLKFQQNFAELSDTFLPLVHNDGVDVVSSRVLDSKPRPSDPEDNRQIIGREWEIDEGDEWAMSGKRVRRMTLGKEG